VPPGSQAPGGSLIYNATAKSGVADAVNYKALGEKTIAQIRKANARTG